MSGLMFIQSRWLIVFKVQVIGFLCCMPWLHGIAASADKVAEPPMVVSKRYVQAKKKQFIERTLPNEHLPESFSIQQINRQDDYCQLVLINLGWLLCGDVQVRLRGQAVDLIGLSKKSAHGVWGSFEKRKLMVDVESDAMTRLQAQSEKINLPIFFEGWMVEPRINPEYQFIYYALDTLWGDQQIIHIQAQDMAKNKIVMVSIEAPRQIMKLRATNVARLIEQVLRYHQQTQSTAFH